MHKGVHLHLQPVRIRQKASAALALAAWGLLVGSLLGGVCAAVKYWLVPSLPAGLPLVVALSGIALGLLLGLVWRRSWRDAATAIDARYGLKDRAATALEFSTSRQRSPVQELAFQDAMSHLTRTRSHEVVPFSLPRVLPYALLTFVGTVVMMVLAAGSVPAHADVPAPLDVVVAQAERAEEELKELEDFAKQEKDPELEKLVQQLKQHIEAMKQPGTDIRQALATLSEMQAALQSEQSKHNPAAADARFQAMGDALALADALADAGQALKAGDYEKAAEQLEKVEAPQLDRQTEKAVKEKLQQASQQARSEGQESLGKAAGQMAEGLSGDAKKFSEGSKKLASEARKQGKRKKLSDLLLSQCNCLGECKGECESESKSLAKKAKGLGKGGKRWGTGGSDGALAERTAQLGGKKLEKITGKQSDEGESETETTHSPEASQEAQRGYRENYAKYKKISESVLDSEPIPLGHRQTIRKYFESIRPNDAETDQVNDTVTE